MNYQQPPKEEHNGQVADRMQLKPGEYFMGEVSEFYILLLWNTVKPWVGSMSLTSVGQSIRNVGLILEIDDYFVIRILECWWQVLYKMVLSKEAKGFL